MKLNNNDDSHNSGLNLLIYNMLLDIESHPAWVCGLKQKSHNVFETPLLSHPAWVCGLKQHGNTGFKNGGVTPCVGVWIETKSEQTIYRILESHPAWVCGLKLTALSALQRFKCHTLRGCVD